MVAAQESDCGHHVHLHRVTLSQGNLMERKDYEIIELTDCQGHDGAVMQLPPGLAVVSPDHQGFSVANGAEITVSLPKAEFARLVEEGVLVTTALSTEITEPAVAPPTGA